MDGERMIIDKVNIGEMINTCRDNRTIFFPAAPLYTTEEDENQLLFFESGYNTYAEDHEYNGVATDGASSVLHEAIFPLKMPTQFDGMNMKMKRFTPNEDYWCGMNDMGDFFDLKNWDNDGDEVTYHATYFERIAIQNARIRKFNNQETHEEAFTKELDEIINTLTPIYPNDENNLKELRKAIFQNEPVLVKHGRYDQNLLEKFKGLIAQGYFTYLPDEFLVWVTHINAKLDIPATPLEKYMYGSYQENNLDKERMYKCRQAFERARSTQALGLINYVKILCKIIDELQIPNGDELKNLYVAFGEFALFRTCSKTSGVVDRYVDMALKEDMDHTKMLSPLLALKCQLARKEFLILQKASSEVSVADSLLHNKAVYTTPEVTQFILDLQPELVCMPMTSTKAMLSWDARVKERTEESEKNMEYILQSVQEYKSNMSQLNLEYTESVSAVQVGWTAFDPPYANAATTLALELFRKYHAKIRGVTQESCPIYNDIQRWRYNYDARTWWEQT